MTIKSGLWINDGGSRLNLTVDGNAVSGTYSSAGGQASLSETYPLTGFRNDDLVGFVVSWDKHKSITSWSGRYTVEEQSDGSKRECIKTIWLLARKYADYDHTVENADWETFRTFTCTYYLTEEDS